MQMKTKLNRGCGRMRDLSVAAEKAKGHGDLPIQELWESLRGDIMRGKSCNDGMYELKRGSGQ